MCACLFVLFHTLIARAADGNASAYERTILAIQQHIESGNLEQARTLISDAVRKYPHDGGIENLLGVVEIQEGHTAAASKAFSDAMTDSPRLTGAYLNLSRMKMEAAASDRAARAEALRLSLKVLQLRACQ